MTLRRNIILRNWNGFLASTSGHNLLVLSTPSDNTLRRKVLYFLQDPELDKQLVILIRASPGALKNETFWNSLERSTIRLCL